MGGCSTIDLEGLSDKHISATITCKGILALARQGKFLDISPEIILDKSKADAFTKGLVCVQATWFVVKYIGRMTEGHSLVLLEIHTIIHVLCALFMYLLWWKVIRVHPTLNINLLILSF